MQTEFPREALFSEQVAAAMTDDCASAAYASSPAELTEDDVALIDLRYDQFMALAELDHLMDDL